MADSRAHPLQVHDSRPASLVSARFKLAPLALAPPAAGASGSSGSSPASPALGRGSSLLDRPAAASTGNTTTSLRSSGVHIAAPSQWPPGTTGDRNSDSNRGWGAFGRGSTRSGPATASTSIAATTGRRRILARWTHGQYRWVTLATVCLVGLWAILPGRPEHRERIRTSLHSAIDRVHDLTDKDIPSFDKSLVLQHPEPQTEFFHQVKPGVRYITSMSYGGHANQFVGIYNLLLLAKMTSRVAIIPTLTPLHFSGAPQNFSLFYDLDRFIRESGIPAVQLSDLKPLVRARSDVAPQEQISCWSVLERVAGNANFNDGSMMVHGMDVRYWPLSLAEGPMLWAEDLQAFDYDLGARLAWIKRVNQELLPQQSPAPKTRPDGRPLNRHDTLKEQFDPGRSARPSDQVFCLDNTFFIASRVFPPAIPSSASLEPLRSYEEQGWLQAGQHIHFSRHLERLADEYLISLFGLWSARRIPPFISVHIRRGDFEQARGLTSLEAFADAVQRVRAELDRRMDDPDCWAGPGHAQQRYFAGVRGEDYAVVATTDERMDSEFVRKVRDELGWRVIDHEKARTAERFGEWYPTMIDAAVLARGRGFVGTEWSTFSFLAGSRVKFWNGGVTDWTPSLK
ncbi:hypothetical protein JCM8202_002703 [Rhodotorula sphaerocarpa]